MGYIIGMSSGAFGIKKEETIMGISRKLQWTATQGVNFTQVDLESITEFKEPGLKEKIKKIKEFGMRFGFHGETSAFGGAPVFALDSAISVDYRRSHERLIISLEESGKLGAEYYLLHSSETKPWLELWREFQPTSLVDFWGRPLSIFLEENPKIIDWLFEVFDKNKIAELKPWISAIYAGHMFSPKMFYDLHINEAKSQKEFDEKKFKELCREKAVKSIYDFIQSESQRYGPERFAYFVVAKYMEMNKDPLWQLIAKGKSIDDDKFRNNFRNWVPAVSAKYWWGHFNPKKETEFKDPKPILEKYKMYLVLETPTGFSGGEDLGRFSRPLHMLYLVKNIGTKYAGLTIDMEHMLGNNIDPKKEFDEFPYDGGKWVRVIHMGHPTPLHIAHKAIYLGSEEQQYIYERMWQLRQKGFKDGIFIFERAAVEDIKTSILALRKIKEYLEKDVPPKELPLDFYGVGKESIDVTRQELIIKQHALDPLKGLLAVPEEEYGFLSSAAVRKGKTKEWKEEEFK
ncbi:MAG: hypothetical protein J7K26_03680 [Candidatus Aenigmarchaeota archaeon]|nr:hypothetical protein [Candidatus Aenigmarchaeota archaeon]